MSHLLVTNDFPPKVGGIQSYLGELWRRLPPERVTVLTTDHPGAAGFDARQPYRVVRRPQRALLPTAALARDVRALANEVAAGVVVLDPALPLGLIGPHLDRPYAVILHGAEVTVPARLPGTRQALSRVLTRADHVVAGGRYVVGEARRAVGDAMPPVTLVPPGVDGDRFRPLGRDERDEARDSFGLPRDHLVVVSVSRLVPRKGMDVLVEAAARVAPRHPGLTVAIAGEGRDRPRLERLIARLRAPVRLLGTVSDDRLPAFYASADLFAMLCRSRWGGLEQEGFGIVFLEAAAAGVPQLAGDSGGAAEAVEHQGTGVVVDRPADAAVAADALDALLDDGGLRAALGAEARRRAVEQFSYDVLAGRLDGALSALEG